MILGVILHFQSRGGGLRSANATPHCIHWEDYHRLHPKAPRLVLSSKWAKISEDFQAGCPESPSWNRISPYKSLLFLDLASPKT